MTPILPRSPLVFVHTPKTGGTAIVRAAIPGLLNFGHRRVSTAKRTYPEEFVFTCVRDPYARLASAFLAHAKPSDDHVGGFATWLTSQRCVRWATGDYSQLYLIDATPDYLMRYERYAMDLMAVLTATGRRPITPAPANVSNVHLDLATLYGTPGVADVAYRLLGYEARHFGYPDEPPGGNHG